MEDTIKILYLEDIECDLSIGNEINSCGLEITTIDRDTYNDYTTCLKREDIIKLRDHLNKILEGTK